MKVKHSYVVGAEGSRAAQLATKASEIVGVNVSGIGNLTAQQVNHMAKIKLEARKQSKFAGTYVKHLRDYLEFRKEIEAKRAEAKKLSGEAALAVAKEVEKMEQTAAKLMASIAEAGQRTQYGLTEIDAAHSNQMNYLGQMHQVNMYDLGQRMQTLLAETGHKRDLASLARYLEGGDYDPYTVDVQASKISAAPVRSLPRSPRPKIQQKSWIEQLIGA